MQKPISKLFFSFFSLLHVCFFLSSVIFFWKLQPSQLCYELTPSWWLNMPLWPSVAITMVHFCWLNLTSCTTRFGFWPELMVVVAELFITYKEPFDGSIICCENPTYPFFSFSPQISNLIANPDQRWFQFKWFDTKNESLIQTSHDTEPSLTWIYLPPTSHSRTTVVPP